MDLSFIIVQILSALYNNDVTALYILINAYNSVDDTTRWAAINDPQAEVNVVKAYVATTATTELHRTILIDSIDSAFAYDQVGCLVGIARGLLKHSEDVLEVIKSMELFEVCRGKRGSKRYLGYLSDQCTTKYMMLTQAGLAAVEGADILRTNHLVSGNRFSSNFGIARMLLLTLCCGAL
nr:19.7 kDa protein [Grapevine leafroll-associated virus 3]WEG84814.1 19.7 kDa protein [Grapevine leafroll-associated virus 3]WEG84827.1 19.7 kDa protein [Grapevine leafroll-associated virus 3]WEG84879.1 19.7 kDa protein [Grapevine leafroll-associated virus 3]WEG84905.1 19.7 kDa protein [Grapevine leafroll-associated virus 3]